MPPGRRERVGARRRESDCYRRNGTAGGSEEGGKLRCWDSEADVCSDVLEAFGVGLDVFGGLWDLNVRVSLDRGDIQIASAEDAELRGDPVCECIGCQAGEC